MILNSQLKLSQDEIAHMEAFVQSPVYKTFQKIIAGYKATVQEELLTAKDLQQVFQLQGRIIGVQAIENFPVIYAKSAQEQRKKAQANQAAKKD